MDVDMSKEDLQALVTGLFDALETRDNYIQDLLVEVNAFRAATRNMMQTTEDRNETE
jgi:hypothetical protein